MEKNSFRAGVEIHISDLILSAPMNVQIRQFCALWISERHFQLSSFRVAKCLRYICVKISKSWGKKIVGIQCDPKKTLHKDS